MLTKYEDPKEYALTIVDNYKNELSSNKVDMIMNFDFSQNLLKSSNNASKSTSLNIGYFIFQHLYKHLEVKSFIDNITKDSKITYNANDINRFLTYSRILKPTSKLGTVNQLDNYFEKPNFTHQHVLGFMDVLSENYDQYIEHLFKKSNKVVKRDTSVFYYDCTNYYFETEQNDFDYIDDVTGERIKGLRKYGISKQHQPSPLVQMGLFMDNDGIPITMCINSGSDNETKSVKPLEEKLIKMVKGKKFVYCADAGLGSVDIRKFNDMGGRAFIVTQSIKKLATQYQEAVFNDMDYKKLSDNSPISLEIMKNFDRHDEKNLKLYDDIVYKVINIDRLVDLGLFEEAKDKYGKSKKIKAKGTLRQKVIITFSRKTMEYQRRIREAQVDRAKNLLKNNLIDKKKKGPNDPARFIKKLNNTKNEYEIDQSIIDNESKYDGFYAIATNLDDDAKDIIAVNSNRYKIEDCFRLMKTNFDARPVYHRNRERITSHFLICYTSLLLFRLLEKKIKDAGYKLTADEILNTLKVMDVINIDDIYYESSYTSSVCMEALNDIFGLELNKKRYLPKTINKIIKNLS